MENRDEILVYIEKIMMGLGSDEEVAKWIEEIFNSVPSRDVIGAIMPGKTVEESVNKLYEANIIYL